jgi:hypothetical protein
MTEQELQRMRIHFKNYLPMAESTMVRGIKLCEEVERLQKENEQLRNDIERKNDTIQQALSGEEES